MISTEAAALNLSVQPASVQAGQQYYKLLDLFSTRDGSGDRSPAEYDEVINYDLDRLLPGLLPGRHDRHSGYGNYENSKGERWWVT